MPRRSIEGLPKPTKRFRPDLVNESSDGKVRFETKGAAKKEDGRRCRGLVFYLKRNGSDLTSEELKRIRRLIKRIKHGISPASAVYMRKHRIRIGGHLWKEIATYAGPVSTFTIIPKSWEFAAGQLHKADPSLLLERLRQSLIRAGALGTGGWLFLGVHGEYEPSTGVYRLHGHGCAFGSMIKVVDRLRKRADYKSVRSQSTPDPVFRRLRMSRKPLSDLPNPLTYTVQSFWPSKAVYELMPGDTRRQLEKHRIKEPRHTEVLLWLDSFRLHDLTLLMGRRVTKSGLQENRKTYSNGVVS